MKENIPRTMSPLMLFVLLFAGLLFFQRIDREPLWLDEAYSAAMASHDAGEIVRLCERDVHPPLYYLALRATTWMLGNGELGLRFLSAACALALVALGFGPVRRIFGGRAASYYMIVASLSPGLLCFAKETRMYSAAAFLVLGTALYGIEAIRRGRTFDFVRFGLCLLAAMYTHYFALLTAALISAALVAYSVFRARSMRLRLSVSIGGAVLLYLPWVPSFLHQIERVRAGFWIPKTDWFLVKFALMAPYAYKYEDIAYAWTSVAAMLLSVALIVWGVWSVKKQREILLPLLLIVGAHALTMVAGIGISAIVAPVFMPRYLICCLGLFLVALAVGLAALPRATFRYVTTLLLVILFLPADHNIEAENFHGPFREAAAAVRAMGEPGDRIVHEDVQTLFPMQWMMPQHTHVFLKESATTAELAGGIYPEENLETASTLDRVFEDGRPFWLVDFYLSDTIVTSALRPPPGWHAEFQKRYEPPYAFTKIALTRFVKDPR